MRQSIHQNYRDILEEMHGEVINPHSSTARSPFLGSGYCQSPSMLVRGYSSLGHVLLGLVFGFAFTAAIFYTRNSYGNSAPIQREIPSVSDQQKNTSDKTQALAGEVELMKKILVGLVESVQSLSKISNAPLTPESESVDEQFPYPVQVTAPKANLRQGPDLERKSLGVVPKDTVLLATDEKGGWIKVSTPKGEEAWISSNVVEAKRD